MSLSFQYDRQAQGTLLLQGSSVPCACKKESSRFSLPLNIYFDADMEAFDRLIGMLQHAKAVMLALPDRSGDD